jgi:hypothetical protein
VFAANLAPRLDNLAFDSQGSLYVSNANEGSITLILPSRQGRTLSPGGMVSPGGVAVLRQPDGGESVFVADVFTFREFSGRTGLQAGAVPLGAMTVSADGDRLVVSSSFAGAVEVWDPQQGQVVEHYPMPVPLNAIRFQDDLAVADLGLGGVVWATTHQLILGQPNVYVAAGLASGNRLWVADWATGIVWQVDFNGKTPLPAVPVASGLANPEGLALDLDGSLLVVEAGGGRLSRIDLTTGEVTTVAEGLELGAPGVAGMPPTWIFNGVAVGPSGAIYITGDVSDVLYRIWPR